MSVLQLTQEDVNNNNHRHITPVTPAAGYVGGKKNLAKTITGIIEKIHHKCYAEPFMGMGGIFLRRKKAPISEVINDISNDVVTFFRVLQRHYNAFLDTLNFTLQSRDEFERLLLVNADTLTDIERAARFLYLQRVSFGGKVSGRNFGVSTSTVNKYNFYRVQKLIENVHKRLAGVVIEKLPWQKFIETYDRDHTLFYLDPPYWGCENYYGKNIFHREDFAKMSDILQKIEGKFLLSINDVPEIRNLFAWANIAPVSVLYTLCANSSTYASELIISNHSF